MQGSKLCLAVNGNFGPSTEDQIRLFKERGFDGFFTGWNSKTDISKYRKVANETGMMYQSIHAPFSRAADFWSDDAEKSSIAVEELKNCLTDCAKNEVPIMIAHTFIGFDSHNPTEIGIENFGKVVKEAEKLGVKIAFENTEGEEYLAALMKAFENSSYVGFCWDTGHEQCYNGGKSMMSLYGDRIFATHINDNLGVSDYTGKRIFWTDDLHLLPFDGICDWQRIARELHTYGFTSTLTFELTTVSKPGRYENDIYKKMPIEDYITEAYKRACRLAAMVHRCQ